MSQATEDYRVELDAYNGPLDLLLFLVKRHEIDLHDIPIAKLTDQYLAYLKLIKAIDVDLAGEFLLMSATLLEIKSQMLIPVVEQDENEEEGTDQNPADPRYELVQQLLAYKRYKDASVELDELRHQWESRVPCHPGRLTAKQRIADAQAQQPQTDEEWENQAEPEQIEVDLEDASVNDLCAAFARILSSIGDAGKAGHAVLYDDTPIGLHAEDIMDRIVRDGPMSLKQVFAGRTRRVEMIGLFLATLELVRLKKVKIVQDEAGGEIELHPRPEEEQLGDQDSANVDWRDPETGDVQYEWPDEASRKRADRRAHLRALAAKRIAEGKAAEAENDEDSDDLTDADELDDAQGAENSEDSDLKAQSDAAPSDDNEEEASDDDSDDDDFEDDEDDDEDDDDDYDDEDEDEEDDEDEDDEEDDRR